MRVAACVGGHVGREGRRVVDETQHAHFAPLHDATQDFMAPGARARALAEGLGGLRTAVVACAIRGAVRIRARKPAQRPCISSNTATNTTITALPSWPFLTSPPRHDFFKSYT